MNIPQLPRYAGNTLDSENFKLKEIQGKFNHQDNEKSKWPNLLHPGILKTLYRRHAMLAPHPHLKQISKVWIIIIEDWKSANVTAFHKKGNRQEPVNYSTISLTSAVCKTMESFVTWRPITNHEGNNLIGDS